MQSNVLSMQFYVAFFMVAMCSIANSLARRCVNWFRRRQLSTANRSLATYENAMSTTLDSEEQFTGWTALGRFAVSCSQAPGTLASEQANTSVVRTNERAHNRCLALVQRLYSLRHLQRLFAYTGHHLQTFPKSLRDRLKTL